MRLQPYGLLRIKWLRCWRREDVRAGMTGSPFWTGFISLYTIEHIGKEFDLLKFSSDSGCVLNIELKSVKVEEDRIRKQLDQNRYYLSHIASEIYSFTYVMETGELYTLDDSGAFEPCGMERLAGVLALDILREYLPEGIENCFRAAEYLICPIAEPDKFLKGKYFLTNQQFDFRKEDPWFFAGAILL